MAIVGLGIVTGGASAPPAHAPPLLFLPVSDVLAFACPKCEGCLSWRPLHIRSTLRCRLLHFSDMPEQPDDFHSRG
jgi:hypothetical protein